MNAEHIAAAHAATPTCRASAHQPVTAHSLTCRTKADELAKAPRPRPDLKLVPGCDAQCDHPLPVCPDKCVGCGFVPAECCCEEEVTTEAPALDVAAVSEAEQVRRQFRDELLALLGRASKTAAEYPGNPHAAALGTMEGGVAGLLIGLCGVDPGAITAARGGRA